MRIVNTSSEVVPVDALRPHPRNPRRGDVGAIRDSIAANGFYGAVVAQKSTGFILAGNHRWEAARQSGADAIPVVWVDVDDDHALRILLADNRTNDVAAYDEAALVDVLRELEAMQGSLQGTGYTPDDLQDLLAKLAGPPDLEELARAAEARTSDNDKSGWLTLRGLDQPLLSRWKEHRALYGSDAEALRVLLSC